MVLKRIGRCNDLPNYQFFTTKSFFKGQFIHTIAYQESTVPFVLMEDYYIENKYCFTQTQMVRKKLIAVYASHTDLTKEFLSIQKDANGIPKSEGEKKYSARIIRACSYFKLP